MGGGVNPGQVVLGCIRKQTEQAELQVIKQCLFIAFTSVLALNFFPCLSFCPDFLNDHLISGNVK